MISTISPDHHPQLPYNTPYEQAEKEFNAIEENFAQHVSQSIVHPKLQKASDELRALKGQFLQELRSLQLTACGYGAFENAAVQMQQQLKKFADEALAINLQFGKDQKQTSALLANSMQRIAEAAKSALPDIEMPAPATSRIAGTLFGGALGGAGGALIQEAFDEAHAFEARDAAHHARDISKTAEMRLRSAIKYETKVIAIEEKTFLHAAFTDKNFPKTTSVEELGRELRNSANASKPHQKAVVMADRAHKIVDARVADALNADRTSQDLRKAANAAAAYAKNHPKRAVVAIGVAVGALAGAVITEQFIGDKK